MKRFWAQKMGNVAIFMGSRMASVCDISRCSVHPLISLVDRAYFSHTLQDMHFGQGIPAGRDQRKPASLTQTYSS